MFFFVDPCKEDDPLLLPLHWSLHHRVEDLGESHESLLGDNDMCSHVQNAMLI